jgi:hypothetical protein
MCLCDEQNAGQNHKKKIANKYCWKCGQSSGTLECH